MTKNFEYTDIDGVKKEAQAFIVEDYVLVPTPFSPPLTGPDGKIPLILLPETTVGKAASLVITRKASIELFRGDLVRVSSPGHVTIGDSNIAGEDANIIGIALEDVEAEEDVEIMIVGIFNDPSMNIFSPGDSLYLDEEGGVTDVRPTSPSRKYLTDIGKSLGSGDILILIQKPITLGV